MSNPLTVTRHSLVTMSDIKLSYFNARGRAETARLILAHAGTGRLELDS